MILKQKAQTTIFAIIGIIIVIILGSYFMITRLNTTSHFEAEHDDTLHLAGEQVKLYIEQCLYQSAVDGLFNKIAPQGGYIDPEYNEER